MHSLVREALARPRPADEAIPRSGRVLAIDLGDVRTGVAITDPDQVIGGALERLDCAGLDDAAVTAAIIDLARQRGACGVVVGLPRTLEGRDGPPARRARAVARGIEGAGLPVALVDERFSTTEAERLMIAGGTRRRERRERIDGVAATIILQSWLEARRMSRGR